MHKFRLRAVEVVTLLAFGAIVHAKISLVEVFIGPFILHFTTDEDE